MSKAKQHQQEPVAIVGFACRLPGGNNTPQKLWDFLQRGEVASRVVPDTRFSFEGHYDGSLKPKTLRQAGGMFLGDVDPADFDAGFFEVSGAEALAMDPNQRQMLEVVFEGLENAGVTLEQLDGQQVGCFVGSYAADYADMQNRDPEDRPPNNALGVGRAINANRLSHFLNIKGPSVTLDTACSGSLQGLDLACRYLQTGDINAAIIATSNLYMSPEHLIDTGSIGSAHSPTALCHCFDVDADGYVKAEAVSAIIVKRLDDAIRDRDPIRAVVLGTASNSNGRTAGIASPSSVMQAAAARAAYAHAGITDLNATTYLECHGTGTQAGDPTEVNGVGSVFAATRTADKPLLIGSVKSNIGHSEPAAGISGLLKAILSIEHGFIPGTPTFINPSPKIDFIGNKVKAFRTGIAWPEDAPRRASVNSFGYGGSNAHAIVQQPDSAYPAHHVSSFADSGDDDNGLAELEEDAERPSVLVLSANDASSLRGAIQGLGNHLLNPRVRVGLADLAYTLSERKTKLWHRAYLTTHNTELDEKAEAWVVAKKSSHTPTFGFVFTGQGAQWPQMGQDLLKYFPSQTRSVLEELDETLQSLDHPPKWSLLSELTEPRSPEHLRQPEFSQPLVTALQLCILAVLESWGIKPSSVVGHSSGEIAAAYAAGLLGRSSAIIAAFNRGRAAVNRQSEAEKEVGMLAVGLGADAASEFLAKYEGKTWIACFNSPSSITVSGKLSALQALAEEIKGAGHFARLLQVDLAYHSELMGVIGEEYETLLTRDDQFQARDESDRNDGVTMFSSVTGSKKTDPTDALYWKTNMVSPVRFDGALKAMLQDAKSPNFLIEIGPSGALAGPVSQVLKSLPTSAGGDVSYMATWSRGAAAGKSLFDVAGRLWAAGAPVDLALVNQYTGSERTIVDLPNYNWNHSTKYWHENAASKDWRFRKYVVHDLLGSKMLGTSWQAPQWRHHLNVANVPWLMDHRMGGDAIMPGAGFVTMAVEALYQKHCALLLPEEAAGIARNDLCYRVRNVAFKRALVLEEGKDAVITFKLANVLGSKGWHQFQISTTEGGVESEHCHGQIRIQDALDEPVQGEDALPFQQAQPPKLWYKCQREIGMDFGPAFQKLIDVEGVTGERKCRTHISLEPAPSKYNPQSYYPIHPAALDGCLQTVVPSNASCDRTNVKSVMIPALIDDFVINKVPAALSRGLSKATSVYGGRGRRDIEKSWVANTTVYDAETGQLAMRITGLNYTKLDVAPKPDPHTFHTAVWKPDITMLTQDQVMYLPADGESNDNKLDTIIALVAFKKPSLSVLEVDLDGQDDTSSTWFANPDSAARSACTKYDFGTTNAKALINVETQFKEKAQAGFQLLDDSDAVFGLAADASYDLVIIKTSQSLSNSAVQDSVARLEALLGTDAHTLLVQTTVQESHASTSSTGSTDGFEHVDQGFGVQTPQVQTPGAKSLMSSYLAGDSSSSISSAAWDDGAAQKAAAGAAKSGNTRSSLLVLAPTSDSPTAHLSRSAEASTGHAAAPRRLTIVRLSESAPQTLPPSLQVSLERSGWEMAYQTLPLPESLQQGSGGVTLVLDELWGSIMPTLDENQWQALKQLVLSGNPLVWVTKGAQHPTTHPDNGMIRGLFRVAMQEDPTAKLITLDVQSSTSAATNWAIEKVVGSLRDSNSDGEVATETEYMERDGILHIQRLMPDGPVNEFRRREEEGLEPVVKGFHATGVQVQLRAERLGTLNSLMWCETEATAPPALAPNNVEVEVMAVGVNFKDVAITMGIVPDDEYNIGFECAGVVKKTGPGVAKFQVGDRVCILKAGSYANRVRVSVDRCHLIPSTMTFEEAATIPSVYLCSLYAMYHLGNLQEGQSVLIHSATGGVGIACIELALHKKADIFVTVGTEEKRQFLEERYGIPGTFADEIKRATGGKGINVAINSLIGELLDATWRIMADGGNMVEIGKRDIVDRNFLSMEPFDRNCSFRAVDMSYTRDITDSLVAGLFDELFGLINGGHLKPIDPITTFGFDDVVAALAYIRSGKHMGKIVISNGIKDDVEMPIRPAVRRLQLQPDVSYLIVGGLKGACGTLAIHMAQHGARHIIVNNRSGIDDPASARVVASCNFYGCSVSEARGDAGDADFVRKMFSSATPQIAGIIQGSMVLRDKPFEMMTLDDYHNAIHAKVQGTWNLHRAAQEINKAPLEFFTMLSSTSGIVGNKGQANYAAANTFLDAFASYRHQLGLRANTVDLGLIQDVGYVAEQDSALEVRFDKRQAAPPMNATSAAETITGIGYPLPSDGNELASLPRFSYLFNAHGAGQQGGLDEADEGGDQSDQALKQLRMMHKSGTADVGALNGVCVEVVSAQFAKILRLDTAPEVGRPLVAYGLDSLSAVELRNWIRVKLGVELTTLDITNTPSLVALCEKVVSRLPAPDAATAGK
ncbi:Fumagillin dodecapentaenoate synthase [Apiospora saccharicola]